MKPNSKKVIAAFNAAFKSTLQAAGIQPTGFQPHHPEVPEFTITTRAGEYTCHHGPPGFPFCSVHGRFHEPDKAHRHVDCNPYSGKWNFDGNGYIATPEQAEALAGGIVERILKLR